MIGELYYEFDGLHALVFILIEGNTNYSSILGNARPDVTLQVRHPDERDYPNVWRAVASYGFMERPNVPRVLRQALHSGYDLILDDITYYVGHETVISSTHGYRTEHHLFIYGIIYMVLYILSVNTF